VPNIVAGVKQGVSHNLCVYLERWVSNIQCAGAILSSVAFPLFNSFPLYLINGTIFEKKRLLSIKCVLRVSLQLLSEVFFILRGDIWSECVLVLK
jgi:hypothetical protein